MTEGTGIMKRYEATIVTSVNIGPGVKKNFYRFPPSVACKEEN